MLIISSSGSGQTNALLGLIKKQNDVDKIYLYAKDLSKRKYEFLIKKREDAGINHLNDPESLIRCSNAMDDIYENTDITIQAEKEKF